MIEDKNLRAFLLRELKWDLSEENELFPLIKLLVQQIINQQNNHNQIKDVMKNHKVVQNRFESDGSAFLHGLGKYGFGLILLSIAFYFLGDRFLDQRKTELSQNFNYSLMYNFLDTVSKYEPKKVKYLQDLFNKKSELKIKLVNLDTIGVVSK